VSVRWDSDTRGRGVGDAVPFAQGAAELVDAMRSSDWVAEEPEVHLLPHLEAACEGLPLELKATRTRDDGGFEVDVVWRGADWRIGEVRRVVYALIGSIAETATYVRQRRPDGSDGRVVFELVTGLIDAGSPFDPHGHTVRFAVERPEPH
jgi:hypothetical protein